MEFTLGFIAHAIAIDIDTRFDRGSLDAEPMGLFSTEVARPFAENIAIRVRERVPSRWGVMHAVPEEILHGQGIAPVRGAPLDFNEFARIFIIEIVAAFEHDQAQVVVLNGPADPVGQKVKLDFHGQPRAGHHIKVHGQRVILRIVIDGHGRPNGQCVCPLARSECGKGNQRAHASFQFAGPTDGQRKPPVQGKVKGRLGHDLGSEILQGDLDLMGGIAADRRQSLNGGDTGVLGDHGDGALAHEKGLPVVEEGGAHAASLSFREGMHALVIAIIHVVLHHRLRTVQGAASCTSRGGRRIADLIALGVAIGFLRTAIGQPEGVIETEVMAHLVGQGLVEVVVVQEIIFLSNSEHPAVQDDAVIESAHRREIGEPQGRHASIEARDHPDVDVVCSGPVAQRLDLVF